MNAANCEAVADLLEPFMDGELAAPERAAVARHVGDCAECRQELTELQEVRDKLRGLPRYRASASLVNRVRETLERAGVHKPAVWERWAVPAATHLCAMLIGLGLGYWVLLSATEHDYLTRELLAAHVRSLMQERPVDVASGDPHRVAPWFAGKLDFAPKVEDLATQGYPLQGGRVDYFQGRRVAVLIFQRRAHVINVFVTPHAGGPLPTSEWRRDGYNIARWGNGEFTFWAISDLNADELDQLARLLGAQ